MSARKLLIASLGIAAGTIACSDSTSNVGNLMLGPGGDYDSGPYDSPFKLDAPDAEDAIVDAGEVDAIDGDAVSADASPDAEADADVSDDVGDASIDASIDGDARD